MVSVSLFAGPPQIGQTVLTNSSLRANGEGQPGWKSTFLGRSTGRSFSETGTSPQRLQHKMGIGAPQYLCREINQSLTR